MTRTFQAIFKRTSLCIHTHLLKRTWSQRGRMKTIWNLSSKMSLYQNMRWSCWLGRWGNVGTYFRIHLVIIWYPLIQILFKKATLHMRFNSVFWIAKILGFERKQIINQLDYVRPWSLRSLVREKLNLNRNSYSYFNEIVQKVFQCIHKVFKHILKWFKLGRPKENLPR